MHKNIFEIGSKIGCYKVVSPAPSDKDGNALWTVKCIYCGKDRVIRGTELNRARKDNLEHQCGCLLKNQKRALKEELKQERMRLSELKRITRDLKKKNPLLLYVWENIKRRCFSKTHPKYKDYGERGITMCTEWRESFKAFCEWSLQHGYKANSKLSIDRIDNDGNYEPDNCRWTDYKTQENNKRNSKRTKEVQRVL